MFNSAGLYDMMWARQDLLNWATGDAEDVHEHMMKYLGNPENEPIFKDFSLLWGILGNAGAEGVDEVGADKLWRTLIYFGVLEAYKQGTLAQFNAKLAENVTDNRLRAWTGVSNYLANVKFERQVLKPLSEVNPTLYNLVSSYYIDMEKLFHVLLTDGLTNEFKTYLERLKKTSEEQKNTVLKRLCDEIVYHRSILKRADKRYLFKYLREVIEEGTDWQKIGFDDLVCSSLTADEEFNGASELERTPLLVHNQEITDFVGKFEKSAGFFEEVSAKIILNEPDRAQHFIDKCLNLMKVGEPKGVVFALALVKINQIRPALTILSELADYGAILEMNGFLHRLLPKAVGEEKIILNMIKRNLSNLLSRKPYYLDYAVQRTFSAVRDFAENDNWHEAADLMNYLVFNGWVGAEDLFRSEFLNQLNYLIEHQPSLSVDLEKSAKLLKIRIYNIDGQVLAAGENETPASLEEIKTRRMDLNEAVLDLCKSGGLLKSAEIARQRSLNSLAMMPQNKQSLTNNETVASNEEQADKNAEVEPLNVAKDLEPSEISADEVSSELEDIQPLDEPQVEPIDEPLKIQPLDEPSDESLDVQPLDESSEISADEVLSESDDIQPLDEPQVEPIDEPLKIQPLDESSDESLDVQPIDEPLDESLDIQPLDSPLPFEVILPIEEPKSFEEMSNNPLIQDEESDNLQRESSFNTENPTINGINENTSDCISENKMHNLSSDSFENSQSKDDLDDFIIKNQTVDTISDKENIFEQPIDSTTIFRENVPVEEQKYLDRLKKDNFKLDNISNDVLQEKCLEDMSPKFIMPDAPFDDEVEVLDENGFVVVEHKKNIQNKVSAEQKQQLYNDNFFNEALINEELVSEQQPLLKSETEPKLQQSSLQQTAQTVLQNAQSASDVFQQPKQSEVQGVSGEQSHVIQQDVHSETDVIPHSLQGGVHTESDIKTQSEMPIVLDNDSSDESVQTTVQAINQMQTPLRELQSSEKGNIQAIVGLSNAQEDKSKAGETGSNFSSLNSDKLPEIEKWNDTPDEPQENHLAQLKNIVKSDEIDKQYAKLKKMTTVLVEKAGDNAQKIRDKVKEKPWKKNGKLSSFLNKIKAIKK